MVHTLRTLFATVTVALLLAVGSASAQGTDQTIVDVAASNPDFSTLVTALKSADLVDTLNGDGPFTVFAPTNEAFAALPTGALDALLANVDQLTKVLTYHVVPGMVTADDVMGLTSATTVEGEPITISASSSGVMVDNANVTATDIQASNGIIHVIDKVLLPPSLTMGSRGN